MTHANVETLYFPHVASTRERILADRPLGRLFDEALDSRELLAFLLEFSSRGLMMTEPAERWSRRAGERCLALGLTDSGRSLVAHARNQADLHYMMLDDLERLCALWSVREEACLDPASLVDRPPTVTIQRYAAIHEEVIASDKPFGHIAIAYEIEGMSTVLGPLLIDACRRILGDPILSAMSFVSELAIVGVGHTAMNEAALDRLLAQHPEYAPQLAGLGAEALNIYLDVLGDCVVAGCEFARMAAAA